MIMDPTKRDALEQAGYWVGDAEDFLELSYEERQMVELRIQASRTIRRRREALDMTQDELARKIRSSQSRIAKMEAGLPGISLDLMFRGLFAVGGKVEELTSRQTESRRRAKAASKESAAASGKIRTAPARKMRRSGS